MTRHTMTMVELDKVLRSPGAEITSERAFFDATQQKLE